MAKIDEPRDRGWTKVMVAVAGVDPDEAGGALAYDFNATVQVDGEGEEGTITLWLPGALDPAMPEKVRAALQADFPAIRLGPATVEAEEAVDWEAAWRDSFSPLAIGRRFLVVPPWEAGKTADGRIEMIIDPGMAFGTGHHATTAQCMELMEGIVAASAFDVGCGAGILAIAAAKLGAEEVIGVDDDPAVIDIARANVATNQVTCAVEIKEGSADSVTGRFDLVVANLFLGPLVELAPQFAKRSKPGGSLVISGVRAEEQADRARAAMEENGFTFVERRDRNGWSALLLRRAP